MEGRDLTEWSDEHAVAHCSLFLDEKVRDGRVEMERCRECDGAKRAVWCHSCHTKAPTHARARAGSHTHSESCIHTVLTHVLLAHQ